MPQCEMKIRKSVQNTDKIEWQNHNRFMQLFQINNQKIKSHAISTFLVGIWQAFHLHV